VGKTEAAEAAAAAHVPPLPTHPALQRLEGFQKQKYVGSSSFFFTCASFRFAFCGLAVAGGGAGAAATRRASLAAEAGGRKVERAAAVVLGVWRVAAAVVEGGGGGADGADGIGRGRCWFRCLRCRRVNTKSISQVIFKVSQF